MSDAPKLPTFSEVTLRMFQELTPEAKGLSDKLSQLVVNIARARAARIEAAVVKCFARGLTPTELRIHTDGGGLELRVEVIVAGEVAETVDLSDLHPERLMRESGKPPA